MPVVTKITTQKNSGERYNVYLDYGKGEEFGFGVDENVLIKYDLKKGRELDEFELTESFKIIAQFINHSIPIKHVNVEQA